PKVSNFSPLVSPSTTINVPRELNSIDVAATFRVPLTTVGELHELINDIEAGKHDELLSEMTNDDHDSINLNVDESTIPSDPIVQSVDINTKSTSYVGAVGASAKDQQKVNSNFRTLVADLIFDSVNISIPRKIVEKKWSMDIRLLKEELTRFSIWVKLHDVPIQVFEENGRSSFARCLIDVNLEADLLDVVTIGIPSLYEDGFTKETIHVEYEWRPPKCDLYAMSTHARMSSCVKRYSLHIILKRQLYARLLLGPCDSSSLD
nr:hypothetical protein [Tanacetum cinerariifolium]